MLSLEYEIPGMFKKYNLRCFFNIEKDCYRITLFDEKDHQTMVFVPKSYSFQVTEIKEEILSFTQRKFPELFL